MKVFPLYEAKPIEQKHAHRNNILDLSSLEKKGPVSYTHLTLPTILRV